MKGMTGFGSARLSNQSYDVTVEVQSVNKRFLDVVVRIPHTYQYLEQTLRSFLRDRIARGHLSVFVTIVGRDCVSAVPPINRAWIDGQRNAFQTIVECCGSVPSFEAFCIELWKEKACFLEESPSQDVEDLIVAALTQAYAKLEEHKLLEGRALSGFFREKSQRVRALRDQIVQYAAGDVDRIRERIRSRLTQFVPESLSHDDRICREVVLYADKADISEELERIDHHLRHVETILQETKGVGKLVEFVLQELLREFNTIGSKVLHAEASSAVIFAKTEIEKMREQVQNVE